VRRPPGERTGLIVTPFFEEQPAAAPHIPRVEYRPWPEEPPAAVDRHGVAWRATRAGLLSERGGSIRIYAPERTPLAGREVRDIAIDGAGLLWIATERGVTLFDGREGWRTLRGSDGLPVEDVRRVLILPNGDRWFATAGGAVRLSAGRWSLFAGRRWLPENELIGVAPASDHAVAFLCRSGETAAIRTVRTTLEEKAGRMLRLTRDRHARLGYVADCALAEPGDVATHQYIATDNDGLWTSLYLAAECFRYAVTGADDARANAHESLEALLRLEAVTGISGYPARAVVGVDEEGVIRSDPDTGEWHTSECGRWLWKGDTSSDELNGHFFAYPIYYELVADDEERRRIAAVVGRIADHLVEHDFCLLDTDGRPTRWGVFSPRLLNYDPNWTLERGLNSLSILSFLKVAETLCGDVRYANAYRFLVDRHHYALNAMDQKILLPGEINYSDDELAFLAYYPLLLYETDTSLLSLYRLSVERAIRAALPQRCPLWNAIASVALERDVGLDDMVRSLTEMPADRVRWSLDNRGRADVTMSHEAGRHREPQGTTVLPYSENVMLKWNGNPYALCRGGDGLSEDDGAAYLLPYWMARFHGLIEEGTA